MPLDKDDYEDEEENLDIDTLKGKLRPGEAIRTDANADIPAEKQIYCQRKILKEFISQLGCLITKNIRNLYGKQFEQVMLMITRAFEN